MVDHQLLPDRSVVIGADAADVYGLLNSSPDGLSRANAEERLTAFSPNVVARQRPYPLWRLALHQFTGPLISVLLAAALITVAVGDYSDTGIILAVAILNGIVGFFWEYKATRAMETVRESATDTAQVRRGGHIHTIPVDELVPGDVVLLETGSRVPADLRLTRGIDILVDESQVTGESVPVEKQAEALTSGHTALKDLTNMVFAGSTIIEGRGEALVVATGGRTELAKVSQAEGESKPPDAPLRRRLHHLMTSLARATLLLVGVMVVIGLLRGMPATQVFMAVVALALAVMPEALPLLVTVALSVGVRQVAARGAVVPKPAALETLGSVDAICTDSRGALTQNHMAVQMIVWGSYVIEVKPQAPLSCPEFQVIESAGCPTDEAAMMPSLRDVLRLAVFCNNAEYYVHEEGDVVRAGSPAEVALLEVASALAPDLLRQREASAPTSEVPFSSTRSFMATVQAEGETWAMYVRGAPEAVLPLCVGQWSPVTGETEPLNEARWLESVHAMAEEGQHVIAVARRPWRDGAIELADVTDLVLYGLLGISDPPRPDTHEAIRGCQRSGIKVIMISDHPATATALARSVGLIDSKRRGEDVESAVLTGEQLADMDDEELGKRLEEVSGFAGVTPHGKLRVVEQLQQQGHVVAVTGDGASDAPALRRADIGVALGRGGAEAAREAADVVLLDDSFASIYDVIKAGRFLIENIRKVLLFLLCACAGEVIAILGALALGFSLPFTAAQILWINVVTNGLLGVALAFEPGEDFVVRRQPKALEDAIFDGPFVNYTALVGLVSGLGTLGVFYLSWFDNTLLSQAQTAAVTTMVMFQIFHTLNCRSLVSSLFSLRPFANPFLSVALLLAGLAQVLFVYWAPMQTLFHTVPLAALDWLLIAIVALSGVVAMELAKWVVRRRRRHLA